MYDKTDNELYAEKWFEDQGFEFKLLKQYISKSKYEVAKNGTSEIFELPTNVTDIETYMKMFENSFNMKVEIERLKANLKS